MKITAATVKTTFLGLDLFVFCGQYIAMWKNRVIKVKDHTVCWVEYSLVNRMGPQLGTAW